MKFQRFRGLMFWMKYFNGNNENEIAIFVKYLVLDLKNFKIRDVKSLKFKKYSIFNLG